MPIAGGDWRIDTDYDYIDKLTPEQAAFEFLRRNPDYDAAYRDLPTEPDGGSSPATTSFAAPWGLRFRGRSASAQRPSDSHLAA